MYGGTTTITVTVHLKADSREEYQEAVEVLKERIRKSVPHTNLYHGYRQVANVYGVTSVQETP